MAKKKRVYISGQISGIEKEAPALFKAAAELLKEKGYETVNPMVDVQHEHDNSWEAFMREDIKALCGCDAIFMLNNWKESRGAIAEKQIAGILNMEVLYDLPEAPAEEEAVEVEEK